MKIKVKRDQSLARLYSNFLKDGTVVKRSSVMVRETYGANPQIKNWNRLKADTRIILFIKKADIDPEKWRKLKMPLYKAKPARVIAKNKLAKKKTIKLSSSAGTTSVSNDDKNTLDMNFLKLGVSYQNKIKNDYDYQVGLSTVHFFALKYSEAEESADQDGFLPEFNLGLSKSFNNQLSIGIGYDYLNYFVLSDSTAEQLSFNPKEVHRINLKPSYRINSTFGVISSLGYLSGAGSGFDASLGLTANINQSSFQTSTSIIGYYNNLNVEQRKESSKAIILSFGVMI